MPLQFDRDVSALKGELLKMGAIAERMIHGAIATLVDRRRDLLDKIYADEKEMDDLQRLIDDETVKLIGKHTPVAGDLRFLLMVARINGELERIGDQTVGICYLIEDLIRDELVKPLIDLPAMARTAEQMVHDALDAFVNRSSEQARKVIETDSSVDHLNDMLFKELLGMAQSREGAVGCAFGLILTARAFERIGDHAVNICEDVIYMVQGDDIRHTGI